MSGLDANLRELLEAYRPAQGPDASFWGRQFDLGLAWVHHPPGAGGLGLDSSAQVEIDSALERVGVPRHLWRSGIGLPLAAPTIAAYGTARQQERFLRPIFTGEHVWCQLFSEPGAGSDIAAMATRAVRRDDEWIINGQKVWTSVGHDADWGILCARTDPDAQKHKGLTYFLVDMQAPGIDVRPLRQITGEAEFDEVYLTDVVLPDDQRLGEVGEGWSVTLHTLAHERAAGGEIPARGEGALRHLAEIWASAQQTCPEHADRVLKLFVEGEALRVTAETARENATAGVPSSAWSFLKLARSELEQRTVDVALSLLGPEGLTYGDYDAQVPGSLGEVLASTDIRRAYLNARALTIAAGTSEIQRTIIADRVLRLPREYAADRGLTWRETARN